MNEKDMAFLIIKHEAVQRGLIGEILGRIEKKGLKIIALKMFEMKKEQVMCLYDNCTELSFFEELLKYNSDCPVIGIVVAGPDANKGANEVCGVIGLGGTVRGDYALVIHVMFCIVRMKERHKGKLIYFLVTRRCFITVMPGKDG